MPHPRAPRGVYFTFCVVDLMWVTAETQTITQKDFGNLQEPLSVRTRRDKNELHCAHIVQMCDTITG